METKTMEITIEPSKFQRLMGNVLLQHQGVALDANVAQFTENGVSFNDISLEVVIINAVFGKGFFLNYSTDDDEEVPFSKSLLEQMKYGFGDDEKVRVFTHEGKIHIEGKTDRYEENLMDIEATPAPNKFSTDDVLGIIPTKFVTNTQILINPDVLSGLQKSEALHFVCDGKKLDVIVEDVGKFTKEIIPVKIGTKKTDKGGNKKVIGELDMVFDAKLFKDVLNQFGGEVWLSFGKDGVVFSQRDDDHMLTYCLTSR
jgi:hypothetical protein